jgi:hypothetical protein
MALSRRLVWLTCAFSFACGAVFVILRGPHPWGWRGFDDYYDLALALARGEGYLSLERIWGYPAFLAVFYRLFGDRPWIPLFVQVAANAAIPWMIWSEFRHRIEPRMAVVAALLVGLFSFNTLFASTQSSDALCTVLITGALVMYSRAERHGRVRDAACCGVLFGAALLCRPQFLLLPLATMALGLLPSHRVRLPLLATIAVIIAVMYAPWVLWTWRVSGRFIPATTHGGVQLWYGSLQVREFFDGFSYNPKMVFESSAFDYSPASGLPLVADAVAYECAPAPMVSATFVYWTDRDPAVRSAPANRRQGRQVYFILPAQADGTVIYYYVDATFDTAGAPTRQLTPTLGSADPFVHFISADHVGDLDRHGDLLDVFDIARMLQHVAWGTSVPFADRLDADHDGTITRRDIEHAVGMLTAPRLMIGLSPPEAGVVRDIVSTDNAVRLVLDDGSLTVPRRFSNTITDLTVVGKRAGDILRGRRSFAGRRLTAANMEPGTSAVQCLELRPSLNRVFYLRDPERQQRYVALALDNLRRDPLGYVQSSLRRAYRLFTVTGSRDQNSAVQFRGSVFVYPLMAAVSLVYFLVFAAGVVIAWRRGMDLLIPAVTILYVPLTVCWVFTEMRYTLTVQPFEFMFMAVALVAAFDAVRGL